MYSVNKLLGNSPFEHATLWYTRPRDANGNLTKDETGRTLIGSFLGAEMLLTRPRVGGIAVAMSVLLTVCVSAGCDRQTRPDLMYRHRLKIGDDENAWRANSLSLSSDGEMVVAGLDNGGIVVWYPGQFRHFYLARPDSQGTMRIAVSPNQKYVASGGPNEILRVWRINDEGTASSEEVHLEGHTGKIDTVVFSRDSTLLAASGWDRSIRVWDLRTKSLQTHIELPRGSGASSIDFSPIDRTIIATGHYDCCVRTWRLFSGEKVAECSVNPRETNYVRYSPDGASIAVGCFDGVMRVFDATTLVETYSSKPVGHKIFQIACHPRRMEIASAFDNIQIWTTASRSNQILKHPSGYNVTAIEYLPSGDGFVVGTSEGTLEVLQYYSPTAR